MTGDYWDVWESVYHANLALFERGSQDIVLGLTARSEDTAAMWHPLVGRSCVVVPATQKSMAQLASWSQTFRLPRLVRDPRPRREIVVLQPE